MDDNSHGTHVSGTVAALNNKYGVVGAASNADIYAVKVLNKYGTGSYDQVIQGIDWAIANKMDIISMSFGGTQFSQALHEVIKEANNQGILIVAAAGNGGAGEETELYPALYPEVISVGAIDKTNARASFSSTGAEIDLVAPGTQILSTTLDGGYGVLSGTSMATPHVTGAVAALWSKNKKWTSSQIKSQLYTTATSLGEPHEYGHGLVNVAKALGLVDEKISSHDNVNSSKPKLAPNLPSGPIEIPISNALPSKIPTQQELLASGVNFSSIGINNVPISNTSPSTPNIWISNISGTTVTLDWTTGLQWYQVQKWNYSTNQWQDVYYGSNTTFIDYYGSSGGNNYYRVASWNGQWSAWSFNGGGIYSSLYTGYSNTQAHFIITPTSTGNTLTIPESGSNYQFFKWYNGSWVNVQNSASNTYIDNYFNPNESKYYVGYVWTGTSWLSLNGNGYVTVVSPPAKPQSLAVTNTTSNSISLSWGSVTGSPLSDPLINYHILVNGFEYGTTTATSYTMNGGFQPSTSYQISLYADNSYWGRSDTTSIIASTTDVSPPEPPVPADALLSEMDEQTESIYPKLSKAERIDVRSAFRESNSASGVDYWATITGPFNEPRTIKVHQGTDFQSNTWRSVFAVAEGIVKQTIPNASGYGEVVILQHTKTIGGVIYTYQSFYAHLSLGSTVVIKDQPVYETSNIATEGNSGGAYAIHLHQEFRHPEVTLSANSVYNNRRYPTSFFYQHRGDEGLKTTFLSRPASSGTIVRTFAWSSYNGAARYGSNVTLWYRTSETAAWTATPMISDGTNTTWYKDLKTLPITFPATVSYYISAQTNSWDGSTLYTGYRPFRYQAIDKPPTDRPFVMYVMSATSTEAAATNPPVSNGLTYDASIPTDANGIPIYASVTSDGDFSFPFGDQISPIPYIEQATVLFDIKIDPTTWKVTDVKTNQQFILKLARDDFPIPQGIKADIGGNWTELNGEKVFMVDPIYIKSAELLKLRGEQ